MIRIGNGYDVHKLSRGNALLIGGVTIQCGISLEGHSDADVLTHSLMDALLGALALGDIGQWFPDNSDKFKNADSINLLRRILNSAKFADWQIVNMDSVIIAEYPKFSDHILNIRRKYAEIFKCSIEKISVKATTSEKLGFLGRKEGIAAYTVLLLEKIKH